MQSLSALEMIQIWEWGQHKHIVDRAVGLLTLALPDLAPEQVASLTVGQRNARLLRLRAEMLGPHLSGFAECPLCRTKLEFGVEVSSLLLPEPEQGEFDLDTQGYTLHCRLPTSHDLAAIVGQSEIEAARQLLITRCIVHATHNGTPLAADSIPDAVIPELASAVSQRDPQAEMQFALECPDCGHEWSTLFDIVSYFWTELGDRVRHLLYDVHTLALAYGWGESDILGMSATRRQLYLNWASERP